MAVLRTGIIGAGLMGKAHAEHLQQSPYAEVVAVCDIRLEAAQAVAHPLGAVAYTDIGEMFHRHPLDLVVIATPDPYHRQPTLAAIAAGIPNIILEKPLATTIEDALAIYEAVERRGVRLFVNFANRAAPFDIATCRVIRDGLLGEIAYGEARLDDNISVPSRLWGERSRTWAAGSSTAHFLLSHVVDLLRWYLAPAEVREVYAIKEERVLGFTPDLYDAYLLFDSGARARIKAEWIKHIDELVEFYLCFSGSEGTLIYNKLPGFGVQASWRANLAAKVSMEQALEYQRALLEAGANTRVVAHRPAPTMAMLATAQEALSLALESLTLPPPNPMALEDCFLEAILQGSLTPPSWKGPGPLPTHEDGLKQTLVIAAIIQSAESGRPIEVAGLA